MGHLLHLILDPIMSLATSVAGCVIHHHWTAKRRARP